MAVRARVALLRIKVTLPCKDIGGGMVDRTCTQTRMACLYVIFVIFPELQSTKRTRQPLTTTEVVVMFARDAEMPFRDSDPCMVQA